MFVYGYAPCDTFLWKWKQLQSFACHSCLQPLMKLWIFFRKFPRERVGLHLSWLQSDDSHQDSLSSQSAAWLWPSSRGAGLGVGWMARWRGVDLLKNYYIHPYCHRIHSVLKQIVCVTHDDTTGRVSSSLFSEDLLDIPHIFPLRWCASSSNQEARFSAMAKGEGGEQYSNASLLNKPVSSDGIQLARKVS